MFDKILIANRGEIAARIIKSCKKLNIKPICVYTDADKKASYLKDAYEKIHIGESNAQKSYLNQGKIIKAALDTNSQAIHPGFGFLAENAVFASRCLDNKINFIGPSPQHINMMGNKSNARNILNKYGIKSILGTSDIVLDLESAKKKSKEIGYPVLLKASAGGGGKGMRLVHKESQLKDNYIQAQLEAVKSFANSDIYIEKYIKNARHIEFQILADNFGNIISLGERECSVQRNHQKLIEEAPANNFSLEHRKNINNKLIKALKEIKYTNAGTVEFLLDNNSKELYFMEMNTRLQVEHPVTEMVAGVDIVEEQIKIAANQKLSLSQNNIKIKGHAIECRINAENPEDNFKPSPGKITNFSLPNKSVFKNIRVDTYLTKEDNISPYYDSMIAKVISYDISRNKALKHLEEYLNKIKITGVKNNISYQAKILKNKNFSSGNYNCNLINEIN